MNDQTPWSRLAKYIAGECSPEEEHEVEKWISADPSREELLEQLRHIWRAAGESTTDIPESQLDVESEWEELRTEVRAESRSPSSTDQPAQEPSRSRRGPKRAFSRGSLLKKGGAGTVAILVLLIGGALLWGPWRSSSELEGETRSREVITERGERATLRLSDGTKVKLNVSSKLRFPAVFGNQDRRVVHLSGEAYFNVPTDSSRPFIVRTGNVAVDVHGTAFNVRAYPDVGEIQVAVEEGNVSLRTEEDRKTEKKVELKSGEVGRVMGLSTLVTTKPADLETHIGWTEGNLVFDDTPLPEVAVRLERWYNLEFVIRDSSLHSLRLTANLESQSLRNVLDVITASLGIHYRIDGSTVVLTSRERPR